MTVGHSPTFAETAYRYGVDPTGPVCRWPQQCSDRLGMGPNERVGYVAGLVAEFRQLPGNEVGGALHVLLDDDNTENVHMPWLLNYAIERSDAPAVVLWWWLWQLSSTQRRRAVNGS